MKQYVKRFLVTFIGMIALFTVVPHVAHAHAILDSSSPGASSVISSTPNEISLRFNENIEEKLASIQLYGSDEKEIQIGKATRDPADSAHVTAQIGAQGISLEEGVYVVVWRVVSADGHPASGAFPFEIGEKSSGTGLQLLAGVLEGVSTESILETPLAAVRYLTYLSVIFLLGFVIFSWVKSPVGNHQLLLAKLSVVGVGLGSLFMLLLQGPYVAGKSWAAITESQLFVDVLGTRAGIALLTRIFITIVWGLLVVFFAQRASGWWKNVAFMCTVGTIATFSLSGHASAGTFPAVFVVVDSLHLLGIAAWVGGLLVMALGSYNPDDSVHRFSRVASWAMPLTIATGVVQGFHLMGGISDIASHTFGKLLLAKTFFVVIVVLIGFRARKLLRSPSASFFRIVRWEALVVCLVIALTSVMVGKTPSTAVGSAGKTFTATQLQGDVLASIEVLPTTVGTMAVHVILSPPGGALSPVKSVSTQFALASKKISGLPVNMLSIGPNHWSGVVQIPYPGTWDLEVRVKPTDTETLLYTAQVEISD